MKKISIASAFKNLETFTASSLAIEPLLKKCTELKLKYLNTFVIYYRDHATNKLMLKISIQRILHFLEFALAS